VEPLGERGEKGRRRGRVVRPSSGPTFGQAGRDAWMTRLAKRGQGRGGWDFFVPAGQRLELARSGLMEADAAVSPTGFPEAIAAPALPDGVFGLDIDPSVGLVAEDEMGVDSRGQEKQPQAEGSGGRLSDDCQSHGRPFMIVQSMGKVNLAEEGRRDYNIPMQIQLGRWSVVLLMPFVVSACSSSPRGVIILCAGDSITAEAYPHFLQRLMNREGPRARVLNYGRSGNTAGEYLAYLARNRDKLAAERPDFVLLELGTNDLRADADFTPTDAFAARMKEVVAVFRSFRNRAGQPTRVLLATIPPVPEGTPFPFTPESVRRVAAEVNPAIRALAEAEGLPLLDVHGLFLENPDLLPGIHPSAEGYRRLARAWHEFLKPFLRSRSGYPGGPS